LIDYPIPANDSSLSSISWIINEIKSQILTNPTISQV
jgi:ribosomal protein S2